MPLALLKRLFARTKPPIDLTELTSAITRAQKSHETNNTNGIKTYLRLALGYARVAEARTNEPLVEQLITLIEHVLFTIDEKTMTDRDLTPVFKKHAQLLEKYT